MIEMELSTSLSLLDGLVVCSNSGYRINANTLKCIIPQGIIEIDSEFAKRIGFVSSRFLSCSYLWGEGNCIIIKTIECSDRRRGYLRELFKAIWALDAEIAVRTPLNTMKEILVHYGFKKTFVQDQIDGKVELWVK
jgi:hypothetical protein